MSVFREKYIKQSQKVRRCVGCANFATIKVGDPYWSCFYADGQDAGGYAMCEHCHDHVNDCIECAEAWSDGQPGHIYECRGTTTDKPATRPQGEK